MKAYFYSNWDKLQDARNKYEEVDIYDSLFAVWFMIRCSRSVRQYNHFVDSPGFFKINLQGKM